MHVYSLGTNTMLCSQVITQCNGGSSQKLLGRSTLFISPDDESKLLVAAGDESTKSVSCFFLTTLLNKLQQQYKM